MAKTETFFDRFDSGSISSSWTATGTVSQAYGQLYASSTASSTNYSYVTSAVNYDLTGSYVLSQLVNAGNQALASWQAVAVRVNQDANNSLIFYVGGGLLVAQKQVATVFTTVANGTTYNPNIHKWFRIRESAGITYWDWSTDGSVWVNYTSASNPITVTSVNIQMQGGTFSGEASATTAIFDNFNVVPNASSTKPVKIDAGLGALNSSQSSSQLVRTSTGNLYAVLISSGDVRVYKSTDNGISWTEKDYLNVPFAFGTLLSATIDGANVIHIAYLTSARLHNYITFSTVTDTFGSSERIVDTQVSTNATSLAIAVDSNNKPHYIKSNSTGAAPQITYFNRIGAKWVSVNLTAPTTSAISFDIQIDNNNVPIISYLSPAVGIRAVIGNKNNATSFTEQTVFANTLASSTSSPGSSLTIDASNNVWLAYQNSNDGTVGLAKHIQTDPWSTWQAAVTNGFNGKSVSLAADQNDIYIFYERNLGGIAYDRYDTVNGKWLGETILQPATPAFRPHNPFVKWSQYFNNGDTGANNTGQQTIEYLFDDGSTVYYDKLVTAQISTGFAEIKFSVASTTTSTSSTSSSTSISTSSTSQSTSTSISTSSTSSSTSISTSSTSSSISTSSTSSSISTSSTSSSTSKSTSTSSTSQSTSTSKSTSTSSTSSSVSTSSTSSSISTSISTSSTSQSTSISTSLSTSSTSSSTSISTSSTSSSISTSSTSSSTSQSTSTSSTSQSTSISTSSSTSSTSSSISTSSTSSSTSTSLSTSSTSQSISISTSISTSSTSQSTSISISTSSTSSSTSLSTSSTSSSISTSTSLSMSSTSQSTSISTSISTSSTSQSTSLSTSTSTTIPGDTTTSTSSTSSSTSISTSSTSSSISTSISTSSTSASTSTSISTSSTSSSTSISTSISTSTSSTSSSTSMSTSTTVSITTSTSSTSSSTSSTSLSSSTSTTMLDVNTFPRAHIPGFPMRFKIRQIGVRIR